MNEPRIDEEAIAMTDPRISDESKPCCDRTTLALCAIGAGLAIGLLVRALRPEPTAAQRIAHLLSELQERVGDTARPALRRASEYANEGAGTFRDGLHSGEARLERLFHDATKKVRRLFS